MARSSLLPDELLRQLVAVGNVDILVGVPTFNNSATVQSVVTGLHVGLARHFPRERTVLISPDGGSNDGTPELVRTAPIAGAEKLGSPSLRTTHRVTADYPGLPGRAGGVRVVFAAADLLRARAVLLVDPDVTSLTPEWVEAMLRPIWAGEADLVLPVHPRPPLDAAIPRQLVRPLLGAAFGRRLCAHIIGDFGCSGRFAARMVSHPMWADDPVRPAFDVWLVATALAEELRLQQAHLGPRLLAPRSGAVGLPELFTQVVGATFTCLEQFAPAWQGRTAATDVSLLGTRWPQPAEEASFDSAAVMERFRSGVRDLEPLLGRILSPGTHAGLLAASVDAAPTVRMPDELWVTIVYEFAAASHRGVMNREHLTQALVPVYLGRTASFFAEVASVDELAHMERLAVLEREYERLRPCLVGRWNDQDGR